VELNKKLQEAGLTGNESKVYLELLKRGELSANQVAKNLGIDRTLTYTILNHLIEKGQVKYVLKDKRKIFSCSDPENLLNNLRAREELVKDLVKELKNVEKRIQQTAEVSVYEGKEGMRTLVNLALKNKGFISFGATGRAFHSLYEMPAIAKNIRVSRFKVRIIGNNKYKKTEPFNIKGVEYKYLDTESEATTSIFGDYVSIHLLKDKPLFILIKNGDIAKSYKNHFEFLWKIAKK
jgi:sugar-specific transcriptional regulator TrmB